MALSIDIFPVFNFLNNVYDTSHPPPPTTKGNLEKPCKRHNQPRRSDHRAHKPPTRSTSELRRRVPRLCRCLAVSTRARTHAGCAGQCRATLDCRRRAEKGEGLGASGVGDVGVFLVAADLDARDSGLGWVGWV